MFLVCRGGNDCGPGQTCGTSTGGSVAGIDEMNTFLDGWVCPALQNGTEYFWFEAFGKLVMIWIVNECLFADETVKMNLGKLHWIRETTIGR